MAVTEVIEGIFFNQAAAPDAQKVESCRGRLCDQAPVVFLRKTGEDQITGNKIRAAGKDFSADYGESQWIGILR